MIEKVATVTTNIANSEIIWTLAWRPNSNQIYYATKNYIYYFSFEISGMSSNNSHVRLDNRHKKTIRRIIFSNDGKLLLCCSFDSTCTIYQFQNDECKYIQTLQGHENEVKCIAINKTGNIIATCGRDKVIWIYEQSTYKSDIGVINDMYYCSSMLSGHSQDVKFVSWHPKEEMLASASYDNTIKLWVKNEDWSCIQTLSDHKSTVWGVSFDYSGDYICSISQDKSLNIYNKNAKNSFYELLVSMKDLHEFSIYSVDWHSQSYTIASGGADNKISIIVQTNDGVWEVIDKIENAHDGDINCVAWKQQNGNEDAKNGYLLASTGDDGMINIYNYTPNH